MDDEEIDPRYAEGETPERAIERRRADADQALVHEPGAYAADVDLFDGALGLLQALRPDRRSDDEYFTWKPPVRKTNYVYRTEVELVRLTRPMPIPEVERHVAALGCRPATSEEAMAVCAAHPHLQRRGSMHVLGDAWEDMDGVRRRLVLTANDGAARYAWLVAPDPVVHAQTRVPVVRLNGWMLPPRPK